MLMYERVAIGSMGSGSISQPMFDTLLAAARASGAVDDPVVRDQLMQIYAMETTKSLVAMRTRAELKAGKAPGPGGSLGKLASSVIAWRFREIALEIAGPHSQAWAGDDADGGALQQQMICVVAGRHRRRNRRDPAQHHRRPRARPATRHLGRHEGALQRPQGRHPALTPTATAATAPAAATAPHRSARRAVHPGATIGADSSTGAPACSHSTAGLAPCQRTASDTDDRQATRHGSRHAMDLDRLPEPLGRKPEREQCPAEREPRLEPRDAEHTVRRRSGRGRLPPFVDDALDVQHGAPFAGDSERAAPRRRAPRPPPMSVPARVAPPRRPARRATDRVAPPSVPASRARSRMPPDRRMDRRARRAPARNAATSRARRARRRSHRRATRSGSLAR